MAMQLHMWIEGNKSLGKIDGPSKMKGREKSFEVLEFNHEVTLPFDHQSGHVAGRRQHHPLSVLKTVDEATPKLYKALTTGEHLTVTIKWFRPQPDGGASEQHYFTTKLENAVLTSIAPLMPNLMGKGGASQAHYEQLSMVYDTITWTFVPSGAEHIDKWEEPAS